MKRTTLSLAAAVLTAGLAAGVSAADPYESNSTKTGGSQVTATQGTMAQPTKEDAQNAIRDWPQASQTAAKQMIDRYGSPDVVSSQVLSWKEKAPFRKVSVMRDGIRHLFPSEHQDVITQEINLQVPIDKVSDLARFDGSIIIDRTKGTVAARSDSEANNLLALNLANDIITGKRDVESARRFFSDTAAKALSGKSSDYTSKLLFSTKSDTSDPGQSVGVGQSSPSDQEPVQNPGATPKGY